MRKEVHTTYLGSHYIFNYRVKNSESPFFAILSKEFYITLLYYVEYLKIVKTSTNVKSKGPNE